jgi:predicted nucleic acid-binding protein
MLDDKFVDTSVLVYAFDKTDRVKHAIAAKIIEEASDGSQKLVVSVQVLLELYNVLTRFISNPLPSGETSLIVNDFFKSDDWIKLNYSNSTAIRAVATAADCKIKIWDVLITETMKENNVYTIITENEKEFKKIPGITVLNPFKNKGESYER